MPNTYTQLYVQLMFAVKGREGVIRKGFRERLEKYLGGIVTEHACKPLAVYCMPDHMHLLIGLNPVTALSDLMREVKASSSRWVNQERLVAGRFTWQEGHGAFSYARSQVDDVVRYVVHQPEHDRRQPFRKEYLAFLERFGVAYDPK